MKKLSFLLIFLSFGSVAFAQKTYTVAEFRKLYKGIDTNDVFKLQFTRVIDIESHTETTYRVKVSDSDKKSVFVIVDNAGLKFMERIQKAALRLKKSGAKKQERTRTIFCTFDSEYVPGKQPFLRATGATTYRKIGEESRVSW